MARLTISPIKWEKGQVLILDQRLLPWRIYYLRCKHYRQVANAIKHMAIRGAPAIGIAAAMGIALGISKLRSSKGLEKRFDEICQTIINTRPTAQNLFWAISRMKGAFDDYKNKSLSELKNSLIKEAQDTLDEDIATNKEIGNHGKALIKPDMNILTHCNAGALATGGYGTALGVMRAAWEAGIRFRVIADETRPYLQGARLTCWELAQEGIPVSLITDSTAGYLMSKGRIHLVIVGADRVALNGDTANKIGTYSLAILAKENNIPFYIAAPFSTIDLNLPSGEHIPIEERPGKEVLCIGKRWIVPEGINALYFAFDITPHEYITGIITERGIIKAPYKENIKKMQDTKNK